MSNSYIKYVILAGLFAIPFVPFIVASSLFFPFIVGKAFVFRAIVEIILAAWIILAIRDREFRPKFTWVSGAFILFTLIIGLADMFAVNSFKAFWSNYERMEGYITILHLLAFFLVMGSTVKARETWNKLLATSVGASAIMAAYSFFQLAGKVQINQGGVRVDGTLGNASYLGIYMVFHIFFAALLYARSRSAWAKLSLSVVGLMDLVVLYYTATRGAILGLLGGAAVTFIFMAWKSEKGSGIRKLALGGILALVILVGAFWAVKDVPAVKSNMVLGRFASLSFSEIQTQGRYYVWPMAWKGFLERPLLGWGQEGFNFVFNKYYDPRMYNQEQWFDRAHSTPLDWMVAGGGLGLLSYLAIFFAALYYIFKSSAESLPKNDKAILLGLLAAYFFNNLFVFDQISSYILFVTVLALMHSNAPQARFALWDRTAGSLSLIADSEKSRPIIEALVVIAAAGFLYFVIYSPWQDNKNLLSVLRLNSEGKVGDLASYTKVLKPNSLGFSESLEYISQTAISIGSNPSAPNELKQGLFDAVNKAFEEQLKRSPTDIRYLLFYGSFLSRFGQYDASLKKLNAAAELSPKKQQIYFELVNTDLLAGKPAEALEAAKTAYELEPSYAEARSIYGFMLSSTGDEAKAQEILKGIPESKLIFDDRYLSVLLSLGNYQKILEIAKKRIELDPTNPQHMITLTAAYLKAGMRQEAINTLEDMVRLNPGFKDQAEYYISEIKAGRNP